MQYARLGQRCFTQQVQGIGAGATGVDDHRFAGLLRRLQMQSEGLLLQLCRFRFVVIVQAGFADRHHPRVIEFLQQPVQRRRGTRLHIQRVYAHRAVDVVITFGQGLDVGRVVRGDTDTQKVPYPALPGCIKGSIQGPSWVVRSRRSR